MIKKIDKPDFSQLTYFDDKEACYFNIHPELSYKIAVWFNEHIEPINQELEKAVRVYSKPDHTAIWSANWMKDTSLSHQALLINIEPIKQDTAESILKEFISWSDDYNNTNTAFDEIKSRARKLLEAEHGE